MSNKGLPDEASAEAGQSLIEVIVAVTVGVLVVSALTFAVIFSLRNAKFSQNQNQATKLAQEGIERVRAERDRSSQMINAFPTPPYSRSWGSPDFWNYKISGDCSSGILFQFSSDNIGGGMSYLACSNPNNYFDAHPETDTGTNPFQRGIIINDDASTYTSQKKATVIVVWRDATGSHESKLTTILRKL